jgi:TP901-1 family phage major tail protein
MAKKLGTKVLVQVSTDGVTWTTVEFQQDGTLTRSSSPADVSNKDSNQHNESIVGFDNWEVSFSGVHDDGATGQEIVRSRLENQVNIYVQMVESGGVKTHSGQGQVTDWSLSGPHTDAVTYSGTIQGTAALTTV